MARQLSITLPSTKTPIVLCSSHYGMRMPPLGMGSLANPWPNMLLYKFHPLNAYPSQGERTKPDSDFDSTRMAQSTMAGRDHPSSVCPLLCAPPITNGPLVPSEQGNLPPSPRKGGPLGLAREMTNLNTLRIPPHVITTVQFVRATFTWSLYDCKWCVF